MSIDTVVARVNKKLGEGTLVKGMDLKDHIIPRVTTGSIALDLVLGGGWPMNCWCEIQGEPSNGKSVIAYKTVAANQLINRDFHCLWIASEQFVPEWAITCGVDLARVTVANTQVMEDAYQIAIDMIDGRLIDAVVIDSLSALVPTEEDDKSMDDWQVALGARITGKFMRKSGAVQRRSLTQPDRNCLGLIISQWREKVGIQYGDNRVTPYGRAKEFMYMVRLEVRRDEWLGSDKDRVGLTFKVRATKNKTAPPQKMAVLDFYWEDTTNHKAGSFDTPKQLANSGIDLEIVEQAGSVYRFGGHMWRGKEAFFDGISTDAALQRALDQQIRQHVLNLPTPPIDIDAAEVPRRKRTLKRA